MALLRQGSEEYVVANGVDCNSPRPRGAEEGQRGAELAEAAVGEDDGVEGHGVAGDGAEADGCGGEARGGECGDEAAEEASGSGRGGERE